MSNGSDNRLCFVFVLKAVSYPFQKRVRYLFQKGKLSSMWERLITSPHKMLNLNGAMFSDVNNVQRYSSINERCKTRSSFNLNKEF